MYLTAGLHRSMPRRPDKIVRKPGAQASAEELSVHCHKRISGYKCPKTCEFRDKLPRTAAGKVQKTELRKTATGARA